MYQNFKVITGLNYRFIGNLHVHVFQHVKPGLCLLQKTLLRAVLVKAGVVKKFAKLFHWYIFLFL